MSWFQSSSGEPVVDHFYLGGEGRWLRYKLTPVGGFALHLGSIKLFWMYIGAWEMQIYATESVHCTIRWLWYKTFTFTLFFWYSERGVLSGWGSVWGVSLKDKYSYIKYIYINIYIHIYKIFAHYILIAFFCTKDTCNDKWLLARLSKVLHSLPDTVLNVGKVTGVRDFQRTVKFAWVQFWTERSIHVRSPSVLLYCSRGSQYHASEALMLSWFLQFIFPF